MAKIEVKMLGSIKITVDGKSIIETMSNKALGIFCYLLTHHEKSITRDKLAFLFWDASSTQAARYNLRHALWSIRKVIKEDTQSTSIITTNKDRCKVHISGDIHMDVLEMERLLKQTEKLEEPPIKILETIKELYTGEFLEGFYIKGCPEFNDWIYYERERFQKSHFEALHKLASVYRKNQRYQECVEVFEKLLRINPLHEELYAELMEVYLEMGDRHAALNLYRRCANILREELNISPGEKIYQLYGKIRENKPMTDSLPAKGGQHHEIPNAVGFPQHECHHANPLHSSSPAQIHTTCPPIHQMHYSWVSNLTENIIISYNQSLLKDFNVQYWQELEKICMTAGQFAKHNNQNFYSSAIEKLRVFQALEQLLIYLLMKAHSLSILVENFQWIDTASYDFIKYFFNKHQNASIHFVLKGNIHCQVIKELEQLGIRFDIPTFK